MLCMCVSVWEIIYFISPLTSFFLTMDDQTRGRKGKGLCVVCAHDPSFLQIEYLSSSFRPLDEPVDHGFLDKVIPDRGDIYA